MEREHLKAGADQRDVQPIPRRAGEHLQVCEKMVGARAAAAVDAKAPAAVFAAIAQGNAHVGIVLFARKAQKGNAVRHVSEGIKISGEQVGRKAEP